MRDLMISAISKAKSEVHYFIHKEKGGSEIIAIVIILGIVVTLGFVFQAQLGRLFEELWNTVTEGKTKKEISDVPK